MSRLYSHRANTGQNSWRIIYVLVSCQGLLSKQYSATISYHGLLIASEPRVKGPVSRSSAGTTSKSGGSQGFQTSGGLVTGAPVLLLGLPHEAHGGAELQPLTYVLEHWEHAVKKSTSVGDWV